MSYISDQFSWALFLSSVPLWISSPSSPVTHPNADALQTIYREDGREDAMYEAVRIFITAHGISPQDALFGIVETLLSAADADPPQQLRYYTKTLNYLLEHEVSGEPVALLLRADDPSDVKTYLGQFDRYMRRLVVKAYLVTVLGPILDLSTFRRETDDTEDVDNIADAAFREDDESEFIYFAWVFMKKHCAALRALP